MGKMEVTPYQNRNIKSAAYGKWFMRASQNTTIDISDLMIHIANDSKIERTKVEIITSAITRQIEELLCNGHPIRIPHLGLLRLGVNSKGMDTVSKFNAGTAIKNVHLNLLPDQEIKDELQKMKFEKVYYPTKTTE